MRYTIPSKKHRAKPASFGLWFKKTAIHKRVIFQNNCEYYLNPLDQQDVNKLFGLGFLQWWQTPIILLGSVLSLLLGIKPPHQRDSARFGWRSTGQSLQMELLAYCYVNGRRIEKHICFVDIPKMIYLSIYNTDDAYVFEVRETRDRVTVEKTVRKTHSKNFSYPLGPYFGGNKAAPHRMTIEMTTV